MMRVLWVVGVMAACSAYVDAHGSLVIPPARNNYRQKDPANMTGNSHMDQVRVVIHTCNNCNHQATHDAGCIMSSACSHACSMMSVVCHDVHG
jgi:hypothetical protein